MKKVYFEDVNGISMQILANNHNKENIRGEISISDEDTVMEFFICKEDAHAIDDIIEELQKLKAFLLS